MALRASLLSLLTTAGFLLLPSRAWAPPLCTPGGLSIDQQVLSLRVRSITIDGVAVSVPMSNPPTFTLQSGCAIHALDGTLLDPDAPTAFRPTFWGLATDLP